MTVAEKNPARKTLGQSARYFEEKNRFPGNRCFRLLWEKRGFVEQKIKAIEGRSAPLDPVVKRGTRGQKKATKEVHLAAYNHIKAAISALKNNEERGKTWFSPGAGVKLSTAATTEETFPFGLSGLRRAEAPSVALRRQTQSRGSLA